MQVPSAHLRALSGPQAGCKQGSHMVRKENSTGKRESMRREDLRNLKDLERVPIARVPLDCLRDNLELTEPELTSLSRPLPPVSLPAKSPTPGDSQPLLHTFQTMPLVTQLAQTCLRGSKSGRSPGIHITNQGLVSTYDELRARLGPQGGIFPDHTAPPSTVWTAYQMRKS